MVRDMFGKEINPGDILLLPSNSKMMLGVYKGESDTGVQMVMQYWANHGRCGLMGSHVNYIYTKEWVKCPENILPEKCREKLKKAYEEYKQNKGV
jgi:hypothetical protein